MAESCLFYTSLVIIMHTCVRKTTNFPYCRGKRLEGSLDQGSQTRVGKLEGQLGSLHCAWYEGMKEPEVLLKTAGSRQPSGVRV